MTETAIERLRGALDSISSKGLLDIDASSYFEKGLSRGQNREDLEANLKLAKCICALHEEIFEDEDEIIITCEKGLDDNPVGFIEEINLSGCKNFRLKVPNSARKLEEYGRLCIEMYGLKKEYPSGFLDVGILMFSCHLIRQYCQAKILKKRFDWKTNRTIINIADKQLSRRIVRVREALLDEEIPGALMRGDRETDFQYPFQFDGRMVQMVILEVLAKNGNAQDVVENLISEPPSIIDLAKKLILG